MVKAIATIIVGNRTFRPGEAVTGLSPADAKWMKKSGYITETAERKKSSGAEDIKQKDGDRHDL